MKCVEMGWMAILVGPTASGKTSLVRLLALLSGTRLRVMPMNSSMDTTELLGGFEQVTIANLLIFSWRKMVLLCVVHLENSLHFTVAFFGVEVFLYMMK